MYIFILVTEKLFKKNKAYNLRSINWFSQLSWDLHFQIDRISVPEANNEKNKNNNQREQNESNNHQNPR